MFWTYRDLNLYYEVVGDGIPVLIIHGYRADCTLMKSCLAPIIDSEQYKKVYIDLPGMGKTKAVDWILNADVLVDILIKFVEEIMPAGKMLVIGQSYGGYLARALMFRLTEKIAGGLFICPVIVTEYEKRILPSHVVLKKENIKQFESQPAYEDFIEYMVVQTPYTWDRYKKELVSGMELGNKVFLDQFQKAGYKLSYDIDTLPQPYDFPAMFLLGRQDSVVGYKDALNIADNFSRGSFLVVDKAGHSLQIEQEELFSCCVYKWLLDAKKFI